MLKSLAETATLETEAAIIPSLEMPFCASWEGALVMILERNNASPRLPLKLHSRPRPRWQAYPRWHWALQHAALLVLAALSSSLSWATLVPAMTLEELASQSQSVVQGKVVRTWSAWDNSQQLIWTHYEVEVSDSLKGPAQGTLVVSEPGGTIGETSMLIAGTPVYEVGEEIVLFTEATPIGYARTCGWGQGKFRVSAAQDGTRKSVAWGRGTVELVESADKKQSAPGETRTALQTLNGMGLDEFKARVRTLIAAPAR
jgi:hypothetical protein